MPTKYCVVTLMRRAGIDTGSSEEEHKPFDRYMVENTYNKLEVRVKRF